MGAVCDYTAFTLVQPKEGEVRVKWSLSYLLRSFYHVLAILFDDVSGRLTHVARYFSG